MPVTPGIVNRAIEEAAADGPVLPTYTVATLPSAADNIRRVVHCSDGNAGAPCLAVSDGANWLRVVFGAAVATV